MAQTIMLRYTLYLLATLFALPCGAQTPGLTYAQRLFSGASGDVSGMTVDQMGNAYLTGYATGGVPVTPGSAQPQGAGAQDAFVIKLGPSGNVIFATYLGGPGDDGGLSIAVDSNGNCYVAGVTYSVVSPSGAAGGPFPVTPGAAFKTGSPQGIDGFVVKLSPSGAVIYSTLIPGAGYGTDRAGALTGIAVDAQGNAYFSGTVQGSDRSLSATPGAFQTQLQGGPEDGVIVKLNSTGTSAHQPYTLPTSAAQVMML